MLNLIQPTVLRIFIRCLLMVIGVVLLTFAGVAIGALFGLSQFWVGWVSAFLYLVLFPSALPLPKE